MEEITKRQQWRKRRRRLYRLRQRAIETAFLLVVLAVIGIPIWLACRPEAPSQSEQPPIAAPQAEKLPYPVADESTTGFPSTVDAGCAVLVDVTENRIVAQRNGDTPAYPASITKVMTLLVAVEHITDYTETVKIPFEVLNQLFIEEASVVGFVAGEEVCMTDLLYGAILPSGADATVGLALHIAGSEEGFVTLMNQKAEELGLKNTHFENTSGLHNAAHKTTALDMAVILREAMNNPLCRQILSAVSYTTVPTPEHPEGIPIYSTMFSRMYGNEPVVATILGGKTGYTTEAGHTMMSFAKGENGHEYIFVSMRGSNRWEATYDAIEVYAAYCPSVNTEEESVS